MKKFILLSVFSLIVSVCNGQEWFTSFDVAKRLARVQDKMLFVLWEESFNYSIPVLINSEDDEVSVVDLSKNTSLDTIIWKYFIPVKLSELEYENFIESAEGNGYNYIDKLNDDSIKIMDVNGNILNVDDASDGITNFSSLVHKYALNTSFLRSELNNYSEEKNFMTAFRLAVKYVDLSIYSNENLRPEIIALANIYLDESERFLSNVDSENQTAYLQRIEFIQINQLLILNKYRKAYRQLKRIDEQEVNGINEPLFAFLNYTTFMLMDDEMNADLWKSKISSLDLKKAELILKNFKNGSSD